MTKVVFVGAYGVRSQGDDAALLFMADHLRRHLDCFEGYVLTRHASDKPYEQYGLHSIENIEYESKSESVGRWFRGLNFGDDHRVLAELMDLVASCQLMVIGAGNAYIDTVIDLFRGPVPYYTLMSLVARMTGVPSMLYGVSVGPLDTEYGRRLTYLSADLASAVTVRDASSADWFRRLGYQGHLNQLPDPVLGLDVEPIVTASGEAREGKRSPTIGISVRDSGGASRITTEELITSFSEIADLMVSELGARVRFIPHCTYTFGGPWEDDRCVARAVVERMGSNHEVELVESDLTVAECIALYGDLDAAISMRLHSNVYAALHGVPTVAVSYNAKVASFMEWLGAGERVVDVAQLKPQQAIRLLREVLANRAALSERIRKRVVEGQREVCAYGEIAAALIRERT